MRPYNVYYLPDMWNDWHWLIYDARGNLVAKSDRAAFHLIEQRCLAADLFLGHQSTIPLIIMKKKTSVAEATTVWPYFSGNHR